MRRTSIVLALLCVAVALILVVPVVSAATAWAPNTYYAVGAEVTYNGSTYQCLQAHTSQVGWEPATTASLWKLISGTNPTPVPTTPPPVSGNLAGGKPVTCSSTESSSYPCSNAVDNNTGTRWASAFSDPQWIYVDLGATYTISRVVLNWEAAYGRSYQIQVSTNASTWTSVYSTTAGNGATDDLAVSGSGRYVRMYGTARATTYGYSLWELQVYSGGTPPPTTPPPTTPPPSGQQPYGGSRWPIPGTVQAENYDTGGEGVAYHDTTAGNSGTVYRTDGVDIQATTDTGGGNNVGWTATGEWLEYSVNVATSTTYTLSARTASQSGGGSMHVEIDGANVTGAMAIPSTGTWQTWATVTRTGISLAAGQHIMRIAIDAAGFNLNWVSLTSGGTPPPTTPPPTTPPPTSPPNGFPSRVFAPYVDTGMYPAFSLTSAANSTGHRYYTLAFVLSNGSCVPMWNGVTPMSDNFYMSDINSLRAQGGDVIVSFGGANGTELAMACTSVASLQAAYQSVINQYSLRWIDLDIEGWAVADAASIDRRNKAVRGLQVANPNLRVAYCLPVMPTGLTQDGLNVLTNAKANGVRIDVVNVMAMDYGSPNSQMGQAAIDAANNTWNQISGLGISAKIGITPMIGQNDTQGEIFSLSNASQVVSYAQSNSNVAMLAMWSAGRDNGGCPGQTWASPTCSGLSQSLYAFINTFKAYR